MKKGVLFFSLHKSCVQYFLRLKRRRICDIMIKIIDILIMVMASSVFRNIPSVFIISLHMYYIDEIF